jgi:hypothetical protein
MIQVLGAADGRSFFGFPENLPYGAAASGSALWDSAGREGANLSGPTLATISPGDRCPCLDETNLKGIKKESRQ